MDTKKTQVNLYILGDTPPAPRHIPVARERRAQPRHNVDAKASIVLVKGGAALRGNLLNLSLIGCRIRCDEKFKVGIYTRVETEFYLAGMSFLLGGVIQAIHGPRDVGIRFLDVSPRKQQQIQQLIDEIEEFSSGAQAPHDANSEAQG